MMELPQYTLHHTVKRMVIPRVILVFVLSPLFYLGIYINTKLLGVSIPPIVGVFIVLILLVMVIVQGILYYVQFQKFKYLFFTNRIEYEGKKPLTFLYADFEQVELKQNLFDKIFNTGSIKLSKEFTIGPISNVTQIKAYMEQLVQYYRYTQQRYKMQQAEQGMQASRSGQDGKSIGVAQQTTAQSQAAQVSQQSSQSQQSTQSRYQGGGS